MPPSPAFAFSCVKTVPARPCNDMPRHNQDLATWGPFLLGLAIFIALLALIARRYGSG
jgi:hypothetical protein